jgi:opacity protein-like surface antigen
MRCFSLLLVSVLILLLSLCLICHSARADGKLTLYGVRMEPDGDDAKDFSRTGWGGGFSLIIPVSKNFHYLSACSGAEMVQLASKRLTFYDPVTSLRTEQDTGQYYGRIYLGPRIGPLGHGFIRPHAGINLAFVIYDISTTLTVPDDFDPENSIQQDLGSSTKTLFGFDINLGVDFSFNETVIVDLGVTYVKSFSVPQQFGEGTEKVHPRYFQISLGIGTGFGTFRDLEDPGGEADEEW